MNMDHFQSEFDKMMNRDYFSSKVHPIREKAFSKFLNCGFPTQKWEDWRWTNISSISKGSFRISEAKDAPTANIDLTDYLLENVYNIVIYNGHFQQALSSVPPGVQLLSGLDFFEWSDWKFDDADHSPFDLLNTAFMDSGMSLVIEPNTIVQKPIRMLFISSSKEPLMIHPRIHIDIGSSSSATFIEHQVGDSSDFFKNSSTFLTLKGNAQLHHIRIQSTSSGSMDMANINVDQGEDSSYQFFQFANGAQLGRLNMHVNLNGEGADCQLSGLALSKNHQHLDHHIITDHSVPHCTSSQNFKSILQDESTGVFHGRTIVRKDAQKTDSNQSNKNLLLSKNALMNSKPQLEIYADDVKCSHGSTTGELDSEALFYLQSRGLDILSAKNLLVQGFANELLDEIQSEPVKEYIEKQFRLWLGDLV